MANIFSKLDKRILIILIIILVAIILLGIAAYRYLIVDRVNVQNSVSGTETEMQASDQDSGNPLENSVPELKIEPEPGLFICVDKCGDGICQTSDPECKDSMNCVCPESQQECPQDCK